MGAFSSYFPHKRRSQKRGERNVRILGGKVPAVLRIDIFPDILVIRVSEFSTDLPEDELEGHLMLIELVENDQLVGVRALGRPQIPVDRNQEFGSKIPADA